MKNALKIFSSLLLVFVLFSCSKDADPVLELYVSAKKSELYQSVSLNHGSIRFFHAENSLSNIQQYSGVDLNLDLTTEDNRILIGNESHWEDTYIGLSAYLGNIFAVTLEGDTIKANTLITASQQKYGGNFELLPNTQYRIEFIYDIDASIKTGDEETIFDTVVEIKIEEL